MKTLWTFGDSFTEDYYPIDNPDLYGTYDEYKKWKGGVKPDVWPILLANKLGYEIKNLAKGGSSNYGIIEQFTNVCELIKEEDIVIFGWSNMVRFTVVNVDQNDFTQILPCDSGFDGTYLSKKTIEEILVNHSNPIWANEIQKWIKFINIFLESINVKVYQWTTDKRIFNYYSDFIDEKRFIVCTHPIFRDHSIIQYLQQTFNYENDSDVGTIERETKGEIIDYHFGEYGHKCQAEYFYNFIQGNIVDEEHKEYIKLS